MAGKKKIMVLGFDGCSYNIITPLIEKGKLPNFALMMREGSWGNLRSTVPPLSGPAWVSFATGKLPGKHGVFDFFRNLPESYSCTPVNNGFIQTKTLWEILSEQGKRVGIMNMLFTYPPTELNGFLIAGRETPSEDMPYTYPEGLKDEILSIEPEYCVELHKQISRTRHFLKQVVKQLRIQEKINRYLLEKYPCDFSLSFFAIPDVINHVFWQHIDSAHPNFNIKEHRKFYPLIEECFVELDSIVGERLKMIDDDTILMIMSDHGAGPLKRVIQLNRWLQDERLLNLKEEFGYRRKRFFIIATKLLTNLMYLTSRFDVFGLRRIIGLKTREKRRAFVRTKLIDWTKTKAYAGRPGEYGIHINLKGREGCGIVDPDVEYEQLRDIIISKLCSFTDPESGKRVFNNVWRREDIYDGPYTEHAPDLILDFGENPYFPGDGLIAENVLEEVPNEGICGMHRDYGVLFVKGKGIKKGYKIDNAHICDLSPTILFMLDSEVPNDMDGKVLTEIMVSSFYKDNTVRYSEDKGSKVEKKSVVYTKEEEEEIKKRLRELGYL